jgi:hypothetical protein
MLNTARLKAVDYRELLKQVERQQQAKDGIQLSVTGQLRKPIKAGLSWLGTMTLQAMLQESLLRTVAAALIADHRAARAVVRTVDQEAVLLVGLAVVRAGRLADHLADRSMSLLSPIASVVLHLERQEILTAKRS